MIRRCLAPARGRHRDGLTPNPVPHYTWDHEVTDRRLRHLPVHW